MEMPDALRLANELENGDDVFDMPWQDAADELRRLHEVNLILVTALEFCAGTSYITDANEVAEKALAEAKEKQ